MTSPAGCISLAQENARITLADCATFRTWIGAGGDEAQTQARNRIHQEALPPPNREGEHSLAELHGYRPYAMIWTAPEDGFSKRLDAVGSAFEFRGSGSLILRFEQDVPEAIKNNPAEIGLRFKNTLGQIIDELCDLAGTAGYLAFTAITLLDGPHRNPETEQQTQGDVEWADLRLEW